VTTNGGAAPPTVYMCPCDVLLESVEIQNLPVYETVNLNTTMGVAFDVRCPGGCLPTHNEA
jgi:hypothetical protein